MKFFILSAMLVSSSMAAGLKEFSTDFCTFYPEGTGSKPNIWKHCCVEHDIYYWVGGPRVRRDSVDYKLYECVQSTGHSVIANIMYYGIKMGHYSPIKIKHDWGWGRGLKAKRFSDVTVSEEHEIKKLLKDFNIP